MLINKSLQFFQIKTLEEIENELLASNQTNKTSSNEFNYQKNQTNKIDSSSQNNNLNKFFPMLNSHNTNQGLKSEEVMMKQKQNLDQLMLSQKQQQLQQQQVILEELEEDYLKIR